MCDHVVDGADQLHRGWGHLFHQHFSHFAGFPTSALEDRSCTIMYKRAFIMCAYDAFMHAQLVKSILIQGFLDRFYKGIHVIYGLVAEASSIRRIELTIALL